MGGLGVSMRSVAQRSAGHSFITRDRCSRNTENDLHSFVEDLNALLAN